MNCVQTSRDPFVMVLQMSETAQELEFFPKDFHDHLILVAVMRGFKFPTEFQIISSLGQHPPEINALITKTALQIWRNDFHDLVHKRKPEYRIDKTHSFILQVEYATEIHDAHMFCFSFDICAYSKQFPEGLFVRNP